MIHNKVWQEREQFYKETMNKYTLKERRKMTEMFNLLIETLEGEMTDVLGQIYMESGISLISSCHKNECYSTDFHNRLLNFAKQMLAKYEKEFEDLEECKRGKNKSEVYAIDFDGTLCISEFPRIIEPRTEVIEKVKTLKEAGHKLILWTCRCGEDLEVAVQWCKEQGLEFDSVNEALPEHKEKWKNDTRKIWADYYIDDKSLRPEEL